jgi:hypothetical protein
MSLASLAASGIQSRTSTITNRSRRLNPSRLRSVLSFLFLPQLVFVALAGMASSGSAQRDPLGREIRPCQLVLALSENFDGATPPRAPWLVKYYAGDVQSGVPVPPADSPPDAAFVDDSATITDKRLDSLSIFLRRPRTGADNVSE